MVIPRFWDIREFGFGMAATVIPFISGLRGDTIASK
jgi:hypothetical protein